jgi:antitoxin ParD1/3/4
MATRNISLTDQLDQFIESRVDAGAYQNASEVVRAGLRLLKAQEEAHALKLERLRAAIQEGVDEIERGEGEVVEWDQLDAWLDGLGRRAET